MRKPLAKIRKLKVPAVRDDVELLTLHRESSKAAAILRVAGDLLPVEQCSMRYRRHGLWLYETRLDEEPYDQLCADLAADQDATALALTPAEYLGFCISRWRSSGNAPDRHRPAFNYWTLVYVYAHYKRERANAAGNRDEGRRVIEAYRLIRTRFEADIELDRRETMRITVH